jgi:hypothetical protein
MTTATSTIEHRDAGQQKREHHDRTNERDTSRRSGRIDRSERCNRIEKRRRERPEGVREHRIAGEPEHEPRRVQRSR